MGQCQSWVDKRLRLGRFLAWIAISTDCTNFSFGEKQLTEGRFRTHWERVGKGHAKETEAERDQAVSHLFVECHWTQEMIAAEMGQNQSWVSRRLMFARFLDFMPDRHKSDFAGKLAEFRFRTHWERVGKCEDIEVLRRVKAMAGG